MLWNEFKGGEYWLKGVVSCNWNIYRLYIVMPFDYIRSIQTVMNWKFWFYCTFKSISIIFLVCHLQLSDFRPVMKLYDLLYPEKQVGKIQDVHLCNVTKIILFNFRSLENDSCQGSANFKIISWQPEIMVTWCKISGSSPKNHLLLQLISTSKWKYYCSPHDFWTRVAKSATLVQN